MRIIILQSVVNHTQNTLHFRVTCNILFLWYYVITKDNDSIRFCVTFFHYLLQMTAFRDLSRLPRIPHFLRCFHILCFLRILCFSCFPHILFFAPLLSLLSSYLILCIFAFLAFLISYSSHPCFPCFSHILFFASLLFFVSITYLASFTSFTSVLRIIGFPLFGSGGRNGNCGLGCAVPTGWKLYEKAGANPVVRHLRKEEITKRRVLISRGGTSGMRK